MDNLTQLADSFDDQDPQAIQDPVKAAQTQQPSATVPDYAGVVRQMYEERNRAMLNVVAQNSATNPDTAAQIRKVAQDRGVDYDVAERNLKEMQQQMRENHLRRMQLDRYSPVLANNLLNPEFAKVAHDDLQNLSTVERLSMRMKAGALINERGEIGERMRRNTATEQDRVRLAEIEAMQERMPQTNRSIFEPAAEVFGQMLDMTPQAILSGVVGGLVAGTVTGAASAIAGPEAVPFGFGAGFKTGFEWGAGSSVAAGTYTIESGNAYLDMLRDGISPESAAKTSPGVGLRNAVLELVGAGVALKPFKVAGRAIAGVAQKEIVGGVTKAAERMTMGKVLRRGAVSYGESMLFETGTETAQEVSNIMGEDFARELDARKKGLPSPQSSWTKDFDGNMERLGDIAKQTAMAMAVLGFPGPAMQVVAERRNVQKAERIAETWKELVTVGSLSKLKERDPDLYGKIIQENAAKIGSPNVYVMGGKMREVLEKLQRIRAEEIAKEQGIGVDEALGKMPSILAQLEKVDTQVASDLSKITDGAEDLVIPTEVFERKFAGSDLGNALLEHIRMDENDASVAEARDSYERSKKDFESLANQTEEHLAANELHAKQLEEIGSLYYEMLMKTGVYSPSEARTQATFVAHIYAMRAVRDKVSPEQAWLENPYTVTTPQDAQQVANQILNQRRPRIAALQESVQRLEDARKAGVQGEEYARLQAEHNDLVRQLAPITPYEQVPSPATVSEATAALDEEKRPLYGKPSETLKTGDRVGTRLDIPAYERNDTWVVTVHEPRKSPVAGGAGPRIGYESVAHLSDVRFSVSARAAQEIAKGDRKGTIATMEGAWVETTPEIAKAKADAALASEEWRQVGMDPERHSYFYDRTTGEPIVSAEEVIQIGPLVLARGAKVASQGDFFYSRRVRSRTNPVTEAHVADPVVNQNVARERLANLSDAVERDLPGKDRKSFEIDRLIDEKDIPVLELGDLQGMRIFPTIADRTASGKMFTGANGVKTIEIPLLGGPLFMLRISNWLNNVVWANKAESVTSAKKTKITKENADVMMVCLGDADMHSSNSTCGMAMISLLDGYMKEGRISKGNAMLLTNLIRSKSGDGPLTKKGKPNKLWGLKDFPLLEVGKLDEMRKYLDDMTFDARATLFDVLSSAAAYKLGAPSGAMILDATREASLAGHRWGQGVVLVKIDLENPFIELGTEGTTPHPDFPLGIRGQVLGVLKYPVGYDVLWQDWAKQWRESKAEVFQVAQTPEWRATKNSYEKRLKLVRAMHAAGKISGATLEMFESELDTAGKSKSDQADYSKKIGNDFEAYQKKLNIQRSFSMARPVVEVTPDLLARIGDITHVNLADQKQADIAASFALERWTKSGVKGGPTWQMFSKALTRLALPEYPGLQDKIKVRGPLTIHRLDEYEAYLALERKGSDVVVTALVNAEQGASGIVMPALILKAIKEGATKVALAVAPIPEELHAVTATLEAFGFSQTKDPLVFQYTRTNGSRDGVTKLYLAHGLSGLLDSGVDPDVAATAEQLVLDAQATGEALSESDIARASAGEGDSNRASLASRTHAAVQGVAGLSDSAAANIGISLAVRDAVRDSVRSGALGRDSAVFRQLDREEEPRTLVATHNISGSALLKLVEKDGINAKLVGPSLGVVNLDVDIIRDFGDVTLIGTSAMVNPEVSAVSARDSDQWTSRFPTAMRKINMHAIHAIEDAVAKADKEIFKMTTPWGRQLYIDVSSGSGESYVLEDGSPEMAKQGGMHTKIRVDGTQEQYQAADAKLQNNTVLSIGELISNFAYVFSDIKDDLNQLYTQIIAAQQSAEKNKPYFTSTPASMENLTFLAAFVDGVTASEMFSHALRKVAEKEGGLLGLVLDLGNSTYSEFSDKMEKYQQLIADEMRKYAESKATQKSRDIVSSLYGEAAFKAVDGSMKPATLGNIIQDMKDRSWDSERGDMRLGEIRISEDRSQIISHFGQLRAALSRRFNSLLEMRKAKKSIVEAHEHDSSVPLNRLADLTKSMIDKAGGVFFGGWLNQEDLSFGTTASIACTMGDLLSLDELTDQDIYQAFIRNGVFNATYVESERDNMLQYVKDVSADVRNTHQILKDLPTDYFEVKSLGEVPIHAFAGVMIPEDERRDRLAEILSKTHRVERYKLHAVDIHPSSRLSVTRRFAQELDEAQKGGILFQNVRGTFDPRRLTTMLYSKADLSTFLHETGHFYLHTLLERAAKLNASVSDREDAAQLLTWFGVKDLDTWGKMTVEEQRKHHEAFAYSFEIYLSEGRAPSVGLQAMFDRFAAWLKQVYQGLIRGELNKAYRDEFGTDLPALTGEVRNVMDKMLASEEQIKHAQAVRAEKLTFLSRDSFMGTDAEWDALQEEIRLDREAAVTSLSSSRVKNMRWALSRREKLTKQAMDRANKLRADLRRQAEAEVALRPEYAAMEWMRTGVLIDDQGNDTKSEEHRLDLAYIEERTFLAPDGTQYTTEQIRKRLGVGRGQLLGRNGVANPDEVAEMFGYKDGVAMIEALMAAKPFDEEVDSITQRRFDEQHGELHSKEAIDREVAAALANDVHARVVATELRALTKSLEPTRILLAAARRAAKEILGKKKLEDIKPHQHQRAATAAANAANEAMMAGDLDAAILAKRRHLLEVELQREALEILDSIDDAKVDLRDFNRPDTKLSKSRDVMPILIGRVLMYLRGMSPPSYTAEKAADAVRHVRELAPELWDRLQPMVVEAEQDGRKYEQLTVSEFQVLTDMLRSIWSMSKRMRESEIAGERVQTEQIVQELSDVLVNVHKAGTKPQVGKDKAVTDRQVAEMSLLSIKSGMRRVESWCEAMDGGRTDGPFSRYIWRPIKTALTEYRLARKAMSEALSKVFDAHDFGVEPISAIEIGYVFRNKAELLAALLHVGNVSNYEKLLLAEERPWATRRADGTIDDSKWVAFIQRCERDGIITQADWQFVQSIWKANESMKPAVQRAHYELTGFPMPEIKAHKVKTLWGEIDGGYVPAITDKRMVRDAATKEKLEQLEANPLNTMPTTGRGMTKARVKYTHALSLDLGLVRKHLDDALRFVHVEPRVVEVLRVIRNNDFAALMGSVDSSAIEGMLIPWLVRSAKQQVSQPGMFRAVDQFWTFVRSRAALLTMAGNVVNALQQTTGLFVAMTKVPAMQVARSFIRFMRERSGMKDRIKTLSKYMRDRFDGQMFELQDRINEVQLNPNRFQKMQAWVERHKYFAQTFAQEIVDSIAWQAAFDDAVGSGASQESAVERADAVVRLSQGESTAESVSRVETGTPFARTLTQFMGYFNAMANLNMTAFSTTVGRMGWKAGAPGLFSAWALSILMPAVVAQVISGLIRGTEDDDDDGDTLDDLLASAFFAAPAKATFAMLPGGVVGNAIIGQFTAARYDDRMMSTPAIAALEKSLAGIRRIVTLDVDTIGKVKDVATLMTMASGLPVAPAARVLGAKERIEALLSTDPGR